MLRLKHVFKEYNNQSVLKDINITLPNKGLISIVGVSGSGKSTLLNLIGGIDKPSKGSIFINNVDVTKLNNKELNWYHNKYLGFIFQSYNLIDYLSVKDNLSLINNNYDTILKKLNIYNLKDKKVNLLSGGEKQRVAIARGIMKNPKILLCDEPTGALDSSTSVDIMNILKDLSKDRLVIVVTHDMSLAHRYSDYILHMQDGKILNELNIKDNYKNIDIGKSCKIKSHKLANNHLNNKKKRNILISISFAIGLISLGLVLSINQGFKKAIDTEEKNSLSRYPILINKDSNNIEDSLRNKETDNNKVYSNDDNHINIITKDYISYLDNINSNLRYKVYKYYINDYIITAPIINEGEFYNEFNILYGDYINNHNDVLLMLDNNNQINKYSLNKIGLHDDNYNYDELINHSFKIGKHKYIIKGIVKAKDNSMLSEESGIIFNKYNFINNIPDEIYLYPKDYDNKLELINNLNKYDDIKYQDILTSIKSISNTLMDGISIVLIVFSIITLVVSSILISILTYINIMEYKREIGIYKSLGISDRSIKNIFYIENILIILRSVMISDIFIEIIRIPINKIVFNQTGLSNVVDNGLSITFIILILSVILSVISSYIPIRNISKLNIVDILRNE